MEIISGNPNVDKSLAGLGMRDDSGRLEKQYSRFLKESKRERDGGWVEWDKQAQCVRLILCVKTSCACMCQDMCAHSCVCMCERCDSVGGDPWSGSPVTGAQLRFCKPSSQCAKQPPEDRISHCDPAPEVTEIHLQGQT